MTTLKSLAATGLCSALLLPGLALAGGKPQTTDPVRLAVFNIPDA
ncbi:MAG: hypothetical protein RLZZ444_556, partial [Pseudomonadota bacterium]